MSRLHLGFHYRGAKKSPHFLRHYLLTQGSGGLGFRSLRMFNASYLVKLGWEIMTKKKALWVQVLRFKYGCGNLLIPSMKSGAQVSHLWRGIIQNWPLVEKGTSWVIKMDKGSGFGKILGSLILEFLVIMLWAAFLIMIGTAL